MSKQYRNQPKQYPINLISIEALNDNQRFYINAINHSPVVVAVGSAGTSKSYVPTTIACQLIVKKKIKKIVICRPIEGPGKYSGHTPGTEQEKLELWVRPIVETMKIHLGKSHFENLLRNGNIEYCDLHKIKGRSFDDCFIICDEAEDMDIETIQSLVTRIGENTKMVINGDIKQKHLKNKSGLGYLLEIIDKYDLPIPIVEFALEDCVRSGITRMFLEVFEKETDLKRDKER